MLILSLLCLAETAWAGTPVSLKEFLRQANTENLSLKAKAASALAEKEGAKGIFLPPPEASLIQMKMAGKTSTGFTLGQSIPFPSKIYYEKAARNAKAESEQAALRAEESETEAKARLLYFRLWAAQERQNLLAEKASILEHHIQLARAVSRSDSFYKIHVLKAESDLDLIRNDLLEAEQKTLERQIEAALFLNQDPKTYRPQAAFTPPTPIPEDASLDSPPQLEAKAKELSWLQSKESEARSAWLPDFHVQYKQMEATPMIPRYSEVMIGASFPFLYFWEPSASSGRAGARRQEGELRYEEESRRIEAERLSLRERASSLKAQLERFSSLLPRAEKRMKIVRNLAPRDMETLQDQRETLEAFPDLKLKALTLRESYEESVANLEKFKSGETP